MIHTDQPVCFGSDVVAAVSSKSDGAMLNREMGVHHPTIMTNRRRWCDRLGVSYDDMVYQTIVYSDHESYDVLKAVGADDTSRWTPGVHADALMTRERGVGLFLPVADCVATVVYDPVRQCLAILHLGRHSSLTTLIPQTISHFGDYGSDPADITVWMSPSAKRDTYRLEWFDRATSPEWQPFCTKNDQGYFLDLPGFNREQFISCGLRSDHITISPVDTTNNSAYFSHRRDNTSDRFAVLAMMR